MASQGHANGTSSDLEAESEDIVVNNSPADAKFDRAVGYIEEILLEDEFRDLHLDLMQRQCVHFDLDLDNEENKLIYTALYNEYSSTIETYIQKELEKRMPDFVMDYFLNEILHRRRFDGLEGGAFDFLFSVAEFQSFKELMIDFKAMKDGGTGLMVRGETLDLSKLS